MKFYPDKLKTLKLLIFISSFCFLLPLISSPIFAKELNQQTQKEIADRLSRQGSYHRTNKNFDRAIQSFSQALLIYQEIGKNFSIGDNLHEIGYIYHRQKKYDQALKYYQQALPFQRKSADGDGERLTLKLIGDIYSTQGKTLIQNNQYRQSLDKFEQSLAIYKNLGLQTSEWMILNHMANAHTILGEYESALKFYQQALPIRSKVVLGHWVGIEFKIGRIHQLLGQYDLALDYYHQALKTAKIPTLIEIGRPTRIGDFKGQVNALNAIGNIHSRQQKYDSALNFYNQALAVIKTEINNKNNNRKILESVTFNNIGIVYLKQKDYNLALKFLQQALEINQPLNYKQSQSVMLSNLGKVYFEQGKYQKAWSYYQKALIIAQEIGYKAGEAKFLSNIGYLLEKQNQPELAIVFFKQSVNVREAIRNNIKKLPQAQQQSYTETIAEDYRNLVNLLLRENRILEAQRVLDLLKIQELEDYLSNVRGSSNTIRGITKRSSEQKIFTGITEQIDKTISQGQELAKLENIAVNERTEIQRKRIIQLRKNEHKITQKFLAFLESPQVKKWITELQISTQGQAIDLNAYSTTLQDNLKKIQQNAVIIYPFVLENRLELVLISAYAPPIRRTVNVKREELNRTIAEFRSKLSTPVRSPKNEAQKLYNWLIKPLENDLKQAKTKTIIYAPDGQLRYIPLAALHDSKKWLIERFRINNITAVSLTELNSQPQNTNQLNILAAAFSEGNYSFQVGEQKFNFSGLPFAGDLVIGNQIISIHDLQALLNTTNILADCSLLQNLGIIAKSETTNQDESGDLNAFKPMKKQIIFKEAKDYILNLVATQFCLSRQVLLQKAVIVFPHAGDLQLDGLIQQLCWENKIKILSSKADPSMQLVMLFPKK
ncbi:MAG: DUF2225 domain-containing protein [Sphaerospermopsis sp. SIO1G2]|nr:DUF2225 domain-containing protein [Sphaerospermopsis sp. SIO1G2]